MEFHPRYKFLYWKWHGPNRQVAIMDMTKGALITFNVDDFEDLEDDLKEYVRSVRDQIKSPHWESK